MPSQEGYVGWARHSLGPPNWKRHGSGTLMTEILRQPGIVPAIIALIGAAIIVPLVKKFYFDVRNRLRVEVRSWNYKISEALQKIVTPSLPVGELLDNPMRDLIRSGGYMTITITNIGKKKISGVSVTMVNTYMGMILQIDDADRVVRMKEGKSIDVGDIQPKHSLVIHIWSNVDTSSFHFPWFRRFLRISANELDAVHLRFPMPRYLMSKHAARFGVAFSLLFLSAFTLLLFCYLAFYRLSTITR